jgi:hypothetical protein
MHAFIRIRKCLEWTIMLIDLRMIWAIFLETMGAFG